MMIQVGIDLGTTNTVCCFLEDGKERFVKLGTMDILPSILMLNNGELLIGERAKRRGIQYPQKLIRSSKTFMGDDTWSKTIEERTFNATDVAAEILAYVRQELLTMKKLPADTKVEAVITVPAYFKAKQREATKEAGERANFVVKGIIQEPVAAAIAATTNVVERERIFVLDLGGGTFDVSILSYDSSIGEGYKIGTVGGDAHLGGDNFDNQILEWLYSQVAIQQGIDLRDEACGIEDLPGVQGKLHKLAEEIKIELSNKTETTKRIANLFKLNDAGTIKPFNFEVTMTRAQFEEQCARLLKKIGRTMKRALEEVELDPSQIDRVLLVGGSSQIPKIYGMTVDLFGQEPFKNYDLSRIVAAGAALYATEQNGIIDMVLPHSLGIEVTRDGQDEQMEIMLPRLAKYPLTTEKIFTTAQDYQESITVYVYEGESQHVVENDYYGSLILTGIERAEKGIPQISISFTFDRDGILSVQAKDLNTNAEMSGQIQLDKQAQKKPMQASTNIILLMDTSFSMGWHNKMNKAKEAANTLVSQQLDLTHNYVAIIGFADNFELVQGFTQDKTTLQIAIECLLPAGGTNLLKPFNALQEIFHSGEAAGNCAIIVTDGCTENESSTIMQANRLNEQGIRIVTIGVGDDVKMDYLLKVSSSKEDCYSIATMDELKDVFAKVSSTLQVAY